MAQLSQLLARLPEGKDVHMSTMGHVLWVCWHNNLTPAVNQTLLNYGGMLVGEEREQALWFFFTDDVFLALARLMVWGNFNELAVSIELFPGRLQLSSKRDAGLSLDGALRAQEMLVRDSLEVWVHPKSREGRSALPGISFESRPGRQGMASVDWATPVVDVRMPYSSTQAWFAILHPLGSPLDKAFQNGWSSMFKRVEALLQKHKIKSIVHETFVMVAVDNLLMLRTFLRDYLRSFDKEQNEPGTYWPCVCVVADRNNLNFNTDLPKKIGLQWDNLMPDFPYISYRNAYLLGDGFTVRDLRFTGEQASMDSWCNVLLDENSISVRSIPLLMAGRLTVGSSGAGGCFYCGIPSHTAAECPTRTYFPSRPEIWDELAGLDLENINEAFRRIEMVLGQDSVEGYEELLEGKDDAALLMQAVLDINGPGQLRNVPRHWLYRMREPDQDEEKPTRDDSPAWDLLDQLARAASDELSDLEKKVLQTITRHQRDPRLRMVRAFLLIEKNDFSHAAACFREAASLTPAPTLQAWNEFLQGRLSEEQGQYGPAIEQYAQVWRVMPQWRDVQYRGIVCRVKMGFAEQVLEQITKLVREEPSYFNRVLIDPGLERGRLLILSSLYDLWAEAKKNAEDERTRINALEARLNDWFPPDHPVQLQLGSKIHKLEALSNINNYIAFLQVVEQRPVLEKELVPFDVLVIAVGVRPNIELLKEAGADCGRGVIVDEHSRTSLKDVYAAGDCTQCSILSSGESRILALLPNAYMQGETAGRSMAGEEARFVQAVPMNSMGVLGLHMVTCGVYEGQSVISDADGKYKRLFVKDGVLKGYIMLGDVERAGIYTSLIREEIPLSGINFELLAQAPQLMAFSSQYRRSKLGEKV